MRAAQGAVGVPPRVLSRSEGGSPESTNRVTAAEQTERSQGPPPPDRRFWIRSAVTYALINLPFLFLTLDTYNINGDIYSSSYLWLGLNPYHAAINVGQGYLIIPGAGYFILPYNMLAFLTYPAFGFSAIAVSALLKVLGILAGFLAARVAYEIAVREGVSNPKMIFYAVLFNPFLIFVNSVAGDADLLIVFLLFLAIFLFRYGWRRPVHFPAVLLGTVAISLTVLSYYFTLLLVPTLLLWLDGRRTKLVALALLAVVLAVFALPIVLFGLGSVNTSSLVGAAQVTAYSFPYYLSPPWLNFFGSNQGAFTALAAVFSVLIPVVFRRWKIGLGTTLLSVLAVAFALTFRLPADVFAILAALVPLSFALNRSSRPANYWTCLLFQFFLIPIYLLAEMFNGTGQVSGIYYWLYPYLHQNTILFDRLGGLLVARSLFAAYFAGTVATIVGLIWLERKSSPGPSPVPALSRSSSFPRCRVTPRTVLVVVGVATLLTAIPLGAAFAQQNGPSLESQQQFNSQEFYAYDVSSPRIYPLAGPATFSVDSATATVAIAGSSPPIGFARNIAETTNRVNLSVTVNALSSRGPLPVWESNETEVVYSSMLAPGPGAITWVPQTSQGAPTSLNMIPPVNGTALVYHLEGQRAIQYIEPQQALSGHREFFAAEYNQSSSVQDTLWSSFFASGESAQSYLVDNYLFLAVESGTSQRIAATPTSATQGAWFLTGFDVNSTANTISAFVNNANVTLPLAPIGAGNFSVYLGKYDLNDNFNDREAWIGNVTGVYSLAPSQIAFLPGYFASTVDPSSPTFVGAGNSATIAYSSSATGGSLRVNATSLVFSGTDSLILFGKLSASPASVGFQIAETYFLRSSSGPNLGYVVLGFGVLLPAGLILWCSRELWISLRHPPSP